MINNNNKEESYEAEDISVSFSFDDIKDFHDEVSSYYSESLNNSRYDQCSEFEPLDEITQSIHQERSKKLYIPEDIK